MKLSEQRISHLAHLVVDGLWRDDLLDYRDEEALRTAEESLTRLLSVDDEVDSRVREQLRGSRKSSAAGSGRSFYDKYFRQEMEKRKW
jgi:hypothetical protein